MPIVPKKFDELPLDTDFSNGRGSYWTKVELHTDESSGIFKYQVNALPFIVKDGKKVPHGRPVRFLDHTQVFVEQDEPIHSAS